MQTDQRGLTLLEVTVVMAIASVVTVGLVSFYLHSQNTWMEGSTQALAQREGTLVLERITQRARHASDAYFYLSPDSTHQGVVLVHADGSLYDFFWNAADSLIHYGMQPVGGAYADLGPCVSFPTLAFRFEKDDRVIEMNELSMYLPTGRIVTSTGAAALYNR
jgi:prepilin-type N-terminal cleavage/methylation domain-containing protein